MTDYEFFMQTPKGAYPGHYDARFIWVPTVKGDPGWGHALYRAFRKTFELEQKPEKALLKVTAGDKFLAYVNGVQVSRGPCRNPLPCFIYYDHIDIAPYLQKGKNVISVTVFWHGIANGFVNDQRPGLWLEADIQSKTQRLRIASDASFKTLALNGWDVHAPICAIWQGIPIDCYDANTDPADFHSVDFDDSGWENAFVLDDTKGWGDLSNSICWEYLEPRETPQLIETFIKPAKILTAGHSTRYTAEDVAVNDTPQRIFNETRTESKPLIEACGKGFPMSLGTTEEGDEYVVFDMGRPENAVVHFEVEAKRGDRIDFAYGLLLKDKTPTGLEEGRHFAGTYVCREGRQSYTSYQVLTAFRYLMLVFRTNKSKVKVHNAGVYWHIYPVKKTGYFSCSDKTLTTLWDAAVNTNLMHLQDSYIMDPVRERAFYMLTGEMEQSHSCYYISCGSIAATDVHFREMIRCQQPNGLFPLNLFNPIWKGFPTEPMPFFSACLSSIPGYCIFYARAVANYYRWFKKEGFLEEQYPTLLKLQQWADRQRDENGLFFNIIPLAWCDWPIFNELRKYEGGAALCFAAELVKFYEYMAEIETALGHKTEAKAALAKAEKTRQTAAELFWDEERGLFSALVNKNGREKLYSELYNCFAILSGIASKAQTRIIVKNLKKKRKKDVVCVSPLYMHYVAEAFYAVGEEKYANDYMIEKYGFQFVDNDFPTLPEGWKTAVRANFVDIHGGGGGVALSLTTRVGGIDPAAPGFDKVRIAPQPGGLSWAKTAVPTPHGLISCHWEIKDGRFSAEVVLPQGCTGEFIFPKGFIGKKIKLSPGKTSITA